MQRFAYRLAPARGNVSVTIDRGRLIRGGPGRNWRVDLASVTALRFSGRTVRGLHGAEIVLMADGKRFDLPISLSVEQGWQGSEWPAYLAAISAVLAELQAREPDMPVTIGDGAGTAWAMFGIGAIAGPLFILGGGVMIVQGLGGRGDMGLAVSGVVAGAFGVMFGLMAVANRPWLARLVVPLSTFAQTWGNGPA